MIRWLLDNKKTQLNRLLGQAIFWDDVPKMRDLLKRGADPDGWAGRQRFLGKALERNRLPMIEMLLEAGADPRQPYLKVGMEFKMSEAARLYEYYDLAERLEKAEQEAEVKFGILPLRKSPTITCPRSLIP